MILAAEPHADATFSSVDWTVLVAYLFLTTLVGARLAGRQSTIRDFFLGGRKLPWWAICGSIIATEISAVTFIGAPAISFARGGNLTYLQLGLGAILARVIIGFFFIPQYYKHEIYSPYDYMGSRLGPRVKTLSTVLFFIGAVLGQGARVFVTAFLLSGIADIDLIASIWLIALFSIAWTLLGGITTVIWTDVIQFCVLVLGALVALYFAADAVPGGFSAILDAARQADKFQLLDLRTDLSLKYTLWCGLLAAPFLNLAAFGCDQVMAQRIFCCKNARDARRAIIASCAGQLVALLMLMVGVALYAYFLVVEPTPQQRLLLDEDSTYVLPIFIIREIPTGIRGLIVAAVFAAAISSLDSALAALSQTTVSAFKKPLRSFARKLAIPKRLLKSDIALSKFAVVVWGVILSGMATGCIWINELYANVINLALGLTAYTYGALLGIFLLAFLPLRRDDAGLVWAVPMTILMVFGISVHVDPISIGFLDVRFNWADWIVWIGAAAILVLALVKARADVRHVAFLTVAAIAIAVLHGYEVGVDPAGAPKYLAWTWSLPIGTAMTLAVGYGLGRENKPAAVSPKRAKKRRPKK